MQTLQAPVGGKRDIDWPSNVTGFDGTPLLRHDDQALERKTPGGLPQTVTFIGVIGERGQRHLTDRHRLKRAKDAILSRPIGDSHLPSSA
tara:strand:- start:575 stop:844 length:270 start_codon:yes stop_codon:yes gene_type:complete